MTRPPVADPHAVIPVPAEELRQLRASHAALLAALQAAKLQHYACEDCWYSCPKSPEGCCNDAEGDECTCGADKHNAAIDAAIAAARKVAEL